MQVRKPLWAQVALAGFFCMSACTSPAPVVEEARPGAEAPAAPKPAVTPLLALDAPKVVREEPLVVVPERKEVVTLEPVSEPRYAPPESLKQFRFPQKNQPGVVLAKDAAKRGSSASGAAGAKGEQASQSGVGSSSEIGSAVSVTPNSVVTVNASGEAPRYKLPDSLSDWRPGRKVPLYENPEAAPWQATPTEPRLQNAAVSCNYKDEGGVRGKVTLLVDDFKVTRFNARIEMPNGGLCQFDSKKMEQRPFEQGIAMQSTGDECVVRMWEQKHRITIAAYSCHKQCSKGSFSYLWPILMDTRIGTCY